MPETQLGWNDVRRRLRDLRRAYRDPRLYQITVLGTFLLYGMVGLRFDVRPVDVGVILGSALLAQLAFTRAFGLPRFDPRSPLISGLSLCLLLRTNHLELAALAAVVTIAGKFLIRVRDKHVFNPTSFGLVVMLALPGSAAWVSPGQWGSVAWAGFLVACLGGLVVHRAARSDVTWAFLASFALIVFGRSWWLNEPPAIPLHRLQDGAFLLFAFFMISDPKTTPDRRAGRILHAAVVAAGAAFARFGLHEPNGLLYALVLSAPIVPVIDRFLRGERYLWITQRRDRRAPKGAPRAIPVRST